MTTCIIENCTHEVHHPLSRRCLTHKSTCEVPKCQNKTARGSLCPKHLARRHRGTVVDRPDVHADWYKIKEGYVVRRVTTDGITVHQYQHRFIMEDLLGRPLKPSETVHHKNLIRWDNRPENLELWQGTQPTGARIEDLLKWADWLIATYR